MGTSCRRCFVWPAATSATIYLCCFVLATTTTTQVESKVELTGTFELRLHRFINLGGCCFESGGLASANPNDSSCPDSCPVAFRICVKNYQAFVDSNSPCIIGEFFTSVFDDQRLADLSDVRPVIFNFNFTWPGSFSLVIEAYHKSETTGARMLVSRFIAQRTLPAKPEWSPDILTADNTTIEVFYRVRCQQNYFGDRCDILCKERNDKFGHYTCLPNGTKICLRGWEGEYCTTAICRAGCTNGHCKEPGQCECRSGWRGELCDMCSPYPGCEHGTCQVPWQCNCKEGWGGLFCNQDLNYCTNHRPCHNNGVCTNTGQGSYTCNCTHDFMGKNCDQLRNPCQENPCQNGGSCLNPSEGNYTCVCPRGFYGPKCETSASICTENPCKHGGLCVHDPGGYKCSCAEGYVGMHCEKSVLSNCTSSFCQNGGTCKESVEGPKCICSSGYLGLHCESDVYCASNPCLNGGTCNRLPNSSKCSCVSGYSGIFCDVKNVVVVLQSCLSNPCKNSGRCYPKGSDFECQCKPGFTGEDCSIVKDSCFSSPCQNGGVCKSKKDGFLCQCTTGYVGHLCQVASVVESSKKAVPHLERTNHPTAISNISHQVSEEPETASSGQVVIILSCSVVALATIVTCAILLAVKCCRRRRREPKAKQIDELEDDEIRQNERNMLHMNNKSAMSQTIVNTLDRVPGKVTNENIGKVLNVPVTNKKVPEKNLLYARRTLERREDSGGHSNSGHRSSLDWPSCNTGGVYVIQDHIMRTQSIPPTIEDAYHTRPPSLLLVDEENVFATEV